MERTSRIEIRVSPEEKERLEASARQDGKTVSQFVRGVALAASSLAPLVLNQTNRSDEKVPPEEPPTPNPPAEGSAEWWKEQMK